MVIPPSVLVAIALVAIYAVVTRRKDENTMTAEQPEPVKPDSRSIPSAAVTPAFVLDLIKRTADRFNLPENLLRAIATAESGLNPSAVFRGNDPGEGDDIGLFQVNERTGARLGYSRDQLLIPELNAEAAARLLVSLKRELGASYTFDAWIAAYNAGAPAIRKRGIFNSAYVARVKSVLDGIGKGGTA